MLSLSLDELDTKVRRHVSRYGLTWPQAVIGPDSKVGEAYRVTSVPTYFVLGPDGRILLATHDYDELRAAVEKAGNADTATPCECLLPLSAD
jgi:hypothetical protein